MAQDTSQPDSMTLFSDMGKNAMKGDEVGGGWGALAGAVLGAGQFIYSNSQKNKAKNDFPIAVSEEMEAAKEYYNRKRFNAFTGSAYNQQMNEIKNLMSGGTEAAARSGSIGNVNYYMRNVAKLTNEMLAQGEQSESNADKNYLDLLNKGDETTRALQLMKYSEDRANQETSKRSGFSNISDAVIELLGKGKKNTRSGLSSGITEGKAGDIVGGGKSMG